MLQRMSDVQPSRNPRQKIKETDEDKRIKFMIHGQTENCNVVIKNKDQRAKLKATAENKCTCVTIITE